jgi:hypothetical protein
MIRRIGDVPPQPQKRSRHTLTNWLNLEGHRYLGFCTNALSQTALFVGMKVALADASFILAA